MENTDVKQTNVVNGGHNKVENELISKYTFNGNVASILTVTQDIKKLLKTATVKGFYKRPVKDENKQTVPNQYLGMNVHLYLGTGFDDVREVTVYVPAELQPEIMVDGYLNANAFPKQKVCIENVVYGYERNGDLTLISDGVKVL